MNVIIYTSFFIPLVWSLCWTTYFFVQTNKPCSIKILSRMYFRHRNGSNLKLIWYTYPSLSFTKTNKNTWNINDCNILVVIIYLIVARYRAIIQNSARWQNSTYIAVAFSVQWDMLIGYKREQHNHMLVFRICIPTFFLNKRDSVNHKMKILGNIFKWRLQ